MENLLLQLNNISVVYSDVIQVLKGVSLSVEKNKIVSLLGSNGAGKTTTLKAISGLLKPENGKVTDGSILYQGKELQNQSPETITRYGIIQVLEGRQPFKYLTIEENLRVGTATRWGKPYRQDLEKVYRLLSRPVEKAPGPGRVLQRRRTPDAGNGPCPDGTSRTCSFWTNLRLDLPRWLCSRSSGSSAGSTRKREPPSFSSNRMPGWPFRSPTTAMSWRTERS